MRSNNLFGRQNTLLSRTARNTHLLRIALWLLLSVSTATIGYGYGARTSLPGPSSTQALLDNPGEQRAVASELPLHDTFITVIEHPNARHDTSQFREAHEALYRLLKTASNGAVPVFRSVQTPEHTWLPVEHFISKDGKAVLLVAETASPRSEASTALKALPGALHGWQTRFPEFHASYFSNGTADNEMFELINSDLDRSLIVTLPITIGILVWSFGSVISAAIPLVIALVSLAASLGAAALISHISEPISATAAQLVVLLVLAIGVDYSLFFVSRMREELSTGHSAFYALNITRRAIGPAVFWSGITVALSLLGLLMMEDTVLQSMAWVSLTAVAITLIGTLLAVPSILALLGERINGWTIFRTRAEATGLQLRMINTALLHPWLTLIATVFILGAASSFCFSMRLGSTVQPNLLPHTMQSARAFRALERTFPNLAGPDFSLVVWGDELETLEASGGLQPLLDEISVLPTVRGPFRTDRSDDGTVMRFHFRALGSTNDLENISVVHSIRQIAEPLLAPLNISVSLGGTLPFAVDEEEHYTKYAPRVFSLVLALSFLFLLIAFRSIAIPLKAVLLNVLSTTAAFGILVLLFQSDYAVWKFGVIESFVPPLLFAILFGLSMDYHVFLLSRIQEQKLLGVTSAESIRVGIGATARTITSAAMIMVAVFAIIASLQLPVMKQLGMGLGIAIVIDATIVRTLLLPASMLLLGDWNWYFPRFLNWLPQIRIH